MHKENKQKYILENVKNYVTQIFSERLPSWAVYHDLQHTIETVNGCLEIGRGSNLTEGNLEVICIAAWFHDVGYVYKPEGHEEKSSEISLDFLNEYKYPANRIKTVIDCIMATKISILPQNIMESVICDSDLISLGKPDYFQRNDLLKLEIELRENKKISNIAWLKRSLAFLSSHNYSTEYAKINFVQQYENNLNKLKKRIHEYC